MTFRDRFPNLYLNQALIKSAFRRVAVASSFVFIAACGSNETPSSQLANESVRTASTKQISNDASVAIKSVPLLESLATLYPNGKLPASQASSESKDTNPIGILRASDFATSATEIIAPASLFNPQAVASDFKPVIRIHNTSLYGAYFFTIYDGERANALNANPGWRQEGAAFWASLASGSGLSPVHRFRNQQNGSYLYTIYESERASISANYSSTFVYEGVAWYAQQSTGEGWSPLYRFRNKANGTYLFSAYESEKNTIVASYSSIFTLEGIAYYVRQDAPTVQPPIDSPGPGYGAAASSCDGLDSVGNPYPCCTNTKPEYGNGNCTWYAAYRAYTAWGQQFYDLGSLGHARSWWSGIQSIQTRTTNANAFVHRLQLSLNREGAPLPVVGSIAVRTVGTYGHVAWVTAFDLNANTVTVKEQNCMHDQDRVLVSGSLSNSTRSFTYPISNFQHYIRLDAPPVNPPIIAQCAAQWTTGQFSIGQSEQTTQACSTGYTGNKILTHTCQAGVAGSAVGVWGVTSTQDNCVANTPVTCQGTWTNQRYSVGQVEDTFTNTCPAGTQGQVRTYHTCQASGTWGANAQTNSCTATPPPEPVVYGISLRSFNSNSQTFGYGVYPYDNTVVIVSGANLSQNTVVDMAGYECNVYAPVTANNFYKIPFNTTGVYGNQNKYTYPSSSGYANQMAAVCLGNSSPAGSYVAINVKSAPGGATIPSGATYTFVR